MLSTRKVVLRACSVLALGLGAGVGTSLMLASGPLGELDPPAGPVVPTGPTLQDLLDRIAAAEARLDAAEFNPRIGEVVGSVLDPETFRGFYGEGWELLDGAADGDLSAFVTITGLSDLPDARGMFLRGMNVGRDDGREDSQGDRPVGSYQADALQSHGHYYTDIYGGSPTDTGIPGVYDNNGVSTSRLTSAPDVDPMNIATETRARNVAVYWYMKVR